MYSLHDMSCCFQNGVVAIFRTVLDHLHDSLVCRAAQVVLVAVIPTVKMIARMVIR